MQVYVGLFVADVYAVEYYLPAGGLFQKIKAPEEGALAAAGGAYYGGYAAPLEGGGYILQYLQTAEGLTEMVYLYHGATLFHWTSSFP